eukprot:TRINITY_DN4461_c0_g1_i1.p1 TRINITY_DN4461_c0_g1~~TRINITY_DN4461_c0_g1_i1.p1  ORF type:complete len:513 (-),score=124.75 TRINITY_DN4461_c0_g1_i1:168-1706(-)
MSRRIALSNEDVPLIIVDDQDDAQSIARSRFFRICMITVFVLCTVGFACGIYFGMFHEKKPPLSADIKAIIDDALNNTEAYDRIKELCDKFGPRAIGSQNLENALQWIYNKMIEDKMENVTLENVTLAPHWKRGTETCSMVAPWTKNMNILGLGGTTSTRVNGTVAPLTASVLVVTSFDDLQNRSTEAAGKIVVFNAAWEGYGNTVAYRTMGAVYASEVGAVAALIRSVTPFSLNTPHTGSLSDVYLNLPSDQKIPTAAITVEDATMLYRIQQEAEANNITDSVIQITLFIDSQMYDQSTTYNVIGDITGTERPDEIIIVSGHIDSWDVGQGAHDDAAGAFSSWEIVRTLLRLNLRPKRTIRVIMWVNEEQGMSGSLQYVIDYHDTLNKTILAYESDLGATGAPIGYGLFSGKNGFDIVQSLANQNLWSLGSTQLNTASSGPSDTSVLSQLGVPGMGPLYTEEASDQYFWYHHSNADTFDKIDIKLLNQQIASGAALIYSLANYPGDIDLRN